MLAVEYVQHEGIMSREGGGSNGQPYLCFWVPVVYILAVTFCGKYAFNFFGMPLKNILLYIFLAENCEF